MILSVEMVWAILLFDLRSADCWLFIFTAFAFLFEQRSVQTCGLIFFAGREVLVRRFLRFSWFCPIHLGIFNFIEKPMFD